MTRPALPAGVVWEQRDFPDANLLLLPGAEPTMVDTGFVSHAQRTAALVHERVRQVSQVVNTHWHSDHVGGNALFQKSGAAIMGSASDAHALARADPGCCVAERLDQPVPEYRIDRALADGDRVTLGDGEWTVLEIPGHTPGHLALWNPDGGLLAAGDAVTSYDVGWVDVMGEGLHALDTAIASLHKLQALDAHVLLPGHGPLVTAPAPVIAKAVSRLERQRGDVPLAVDYGAKRVLAFALMIRGGMTPDDLDAYLAAQSWAQDAAATVGRGIEDFARSLVDRMIATGALRLRNGTVQAATASTPVDPATLDLPFPRDWLPQSETHRH